MKEISLTPIGYVKSPYTKLENMPKNTSESMDVQAKIVMDEKYLECMCDMKSGEKYILLFYFHKSEGYEDKVHFRATGPIMGLFSTHAPRRPNPIGVSEIEIIDVDENIITFKGVDMLDETPVLDLKKIY